MTADLPDFRWKEVNCFTRPQALMCERVLARGGGSFLFLESLYRTWGLDGYFAAPGRTHFRFAEDVLPTAGLDFRLHRIAAPDDVHERLIACLRDGPVLLPANLRGSPQAQGREADIAHYFLVTRSDGHEAFEVHDPLHDEDPNAIPVYRDARLTFANVDALVKAYWRSHVEGGLRTPHQESGYWILQVAAGIRPAGSWAAMVLETYRQAFAPERRTAPDAFFDMRHLHAALHASETNGSTPAAALRGYLSEANECAVHLRLLVHAAREQPGLDVAQLEARIERHLADAAGLRTGAMVRALTDGASRRDSLADAAQRLWHEAQTARDDILELLGDAATAVR